MAEPDSPPATSGPWIESPFFEAEMAHRDLDPESASRARQFHEQGYLVLEGVATASLTERVISDMRPRFDGIAGGGRVQDAWTFSSAVREVATLAPVLDVLRFLYGRSAIPFQTLDFKWGTQQRAHADFLHFSSIPTRFMCGAWLALEDVDADNGPLFYYPGSNRLAELGPQDLSLTPENFESQRYEDFQERLMEAKGLRPIEFHAKRGDVLIWSSNIVHGGMPVRAPERTRWSQVTHYYFPDCIYYTPMESELSLGEIALRENVVDIATLRHVVPSYDGRPIRVHHLANGRVRVRVRGATSPRRALEGVARRVVRRVRGHRNRTRAARL